MKLLIIIWILLLSGCKNEIKIEYEIIDENIVYAYNLLNEDIEIIYSDYKINNYNDVFILCTKYQNYLPLNYSFMSTSNVNLIDSYIKDNNVYYIVDEYIYYCKNYEIFLEILNKFNKLLGYDNTYLMINNKKRQNCM